MKAKDTLPFKVRKWGKIQPDKLAIAYGENSVSWSELNHLIDSCINSLIQSGAGQGDYAAVSAVMKPEYIAAFIAVKELRATVIPISKNSSAGEAQDIISRTHAKIFLTDNPAYNNIPDCKILSLSESCNAEIKHTFMTDEDEEIPDDEITEILFTSGTTGKPKGAMLSQSEIAASIFNTSTGIDMRNSDILLLPVPLNHSFGLRVMRSALSLGESIVLQNGFSFARETQRNIERWKCNCAVMVYAGFERLRQQMGDAYRTCFANMRYIEFSAGHVPVHTRRELRESLPGVRLNNTWGSTETGGGLFIEFSSCDESKLESCGKAINDIHAKITDSSGGWGRLALKSSAVLSGYFDDDELTAKTLHDGWLYTNDLARIDSDGYVYLNGRIDDIISVGGEKVSPSDIERIISDIPGINECACVGVHDSVLGERPAVFIVGSYDAKQIEEAIRTIGNAYMIPSEYVNIERLPRNEMGKLDRKKLRELLNEHRDSDSHSDSAGLPERFINLILTRRSIRTFTDEPVDMAALDKILLAGRMAPTGHNMQTWRFTVIREREYIERIRDTAKRAASEKHTLFYGFNNPKILIIISNDKRNPDGIMDSSAAAENILLACHALGLGACWISALRFISDEPDIRALLNELGIPENHIAYISIGLGHYANVPDMPVKKENVIYFAD